MTDIYYLKMHIIKTLNMQLSGLCSLLTNSNWNINFVYDVSDVQSNVLNQLIHYEPLKMSELSRFNVFDIYRVSRNSLDKEKFEYLRHISTKWANILTINKWTLMVHMHKRSTVTSRFEVFTNDFNKEL